MDTKNKATRKWSELRGMPVAVPSEGRIVGNIADFFFSPESGAIRAFSVRTQLNGDLSLPVRAIKAIDKTITIENSNLLLKARSLYPAGQDLCGLKIIDEDGSAVGTVGELWLALDPIAAPRLAALSLNGKRPKSFSANAITRYDNDEIVIDKHIAKKLR